MGILCLHWNFIEIKPGPKFGALKKYERSDVTFSYVRENIEWFDQLTF